MIVARNKLTLCALVTAALSHMLTFSQVTAWDLVAGCFDICGASPRRFFFEVLHSFATNEVEKERLQYLATPEGRDDLYRYNQQEGENATNFPFNQITLPS